MDLERELIRKKLLDPDLMKLIKKTSSFSIHKSVEISEKARQAGNLLYVQKEHTREMHETNLNCFSMSIAFAPTASEELALGYGNRSALLLHLKNFQGSILDIDRALSISKSKSLKVKLLCRKVECLTALNLSESSTVFKKAVEYFNKIDEKDIENKSHLHTVLTKTKLVLDSKNVILKYNLNRRLKLQISQKQSGDFNSVDVRNSNKYGRHLIATRHIKPGEIFYKEKPFVVCPNGVKLYIYCSHCLTIAWNGIPCKYCNWCIFCSSKCRKEAWIKYHHVECSIITHMIELNRNYSQNFQMSLRAVVMGLQEYGNIDKLKAEIEVMNSCKDYHIQHLLSDEKCQSSKFCSIFNLSSCIKDKHFEINICNAAIALSYAAKYTTLFGRNVLESDACNSIADNEEVLFSGCLLLKFVQICNKHAYSFSTSMKMCKHADETVKCLKKYCKDKLTYLAPISSLTNNSCIPNMRRCFTKDQKIIFYALESIAKNAQV
ncbi:SET and MYND domain-containing protein 4-like [Phymastichus coffea]|uniref:SET and MYND domain-containing protein 4-like n=1 Tax=Phymastichus coffea TaxID=108790 RepID=UPI00273AC5E5|nr:SET and MYND domain-containing protein 4-like [Phymastichus coffea]